MTTWKDFLLAVDETPPPEEVMTEAATFFETNLSLASPAKAVGIEESDVTAHADVPKKLPVNLFSHAV